MWRAYDIAGVELHEEGQCPPEGVTTQLLGNMEPCRLWPLPPQASRGVDGVCCDRMVRIPPGFLSC